VSTYCTQDDILGEIQEADLISLTDDESPPTGDVNATVLNQIIANASGVIDRMVGNVYDVPFSPAPPSVVSLCISIVCYRLFRRREVPDEKNKFTEDYRLAMRMLEGVNKGEQFLDLSVQRDAPMVAANVMASPWGSGNQTASSR
jgi:phage gp36-like protein